MSKLGSNNETDSLEEFFSGKLKNESMQPSAKVWQQIEGSLNQDKKRRRGFIWLFFSGLFLIATGVATYVGMSNQTEPALSKTNEIKNKTSIAVADKKTLAETKKKEIATTENETNVITDVSTPEKTTVAEENTNKEEETKNVKIQLGAFKNQIDKRIFDKTGLDIKQETNENGVTRYYTEVAENKKQATLQKLQQAGFADAFIKDNTLLAATNTKANQTTKSTKVNETALPVAATTKNAATTLAKTKTTNQALPLASNNKQWKNETAKNGNIKTTEDNIGQTPPNVVTAANTNTVGTNTKPDELVPSAEIAQTDTVVKKTDENTEPPLAATDSTKAEEKKKDEPIVAKTNVDSLPTTEKISRWAILLTGGPNFFIKNTNSYSGMGNGSGEKELTTYNTSLKVEYRLLKRFSMSLGINYSYFTAQQDATLFYFPRYQTNDFIFYSSYDYMPVSMSTMLTGYNPAPGLTTLKANYSYTSKINTLQVPIEAKVYVVNGKQINLFATAGASAMFVTSEQTNLSIIKEHLTNNLSYNKINTLKYDALMMLGLGGDVRLYKKLYFTADGGFRYTIGNLSPAGTNRSAGTNPIYFSVNGGLKIKL